MAELSPGVFFIVCPLVFLAGFVDSIAGGGGLISLPAYLFAGVPAHAALGTNKLSSIMGTAAASYRYYKNGLVDLLFCGPSAAAALAGSALGASLALLISPRYLQWTLIIVLPVIGFYVLGKKELRPREPAFSRKKTILAAAAVSFCAGCYDGFFGPGTGAFLILLYTGLARLDPRSAAGNSKLVNAASNAGALALFLYHRRAVLPLGLAAGVFSIAGSCLGSALVIRRGEGILRLFIPGVLGLLLLKIAYDLFLRGSILG